MNSRVSWIDSGILIVIMLTNKVTRCSIGLLLNTCISINANQSPYKLNYHDIVNMQKVAIGCKGGKETLTQIREEGDSWDKFKKKTRIRKKRWRRRMISFMLTDLARHLYSLWSLLRSSSSYSPQHSASSRWPRFVLRPCLASARLGFVEGEAAWWWGDRGLQGANPRGGGWRWMAPWGSGWIVLVMVEKVLLLRKSRSRRGWADGAQISSVGGGKSGRALEQLPFPLLGNLSWEEGRCVALQPSARRHNHGSKHSRRLLWW